MPEANYPKQVSDWMDKIPKMVMSDPKSCLEHIDLLENYAREAHSDYLLGWGLFYRGFVRYLQAELNESMHLFSAALNLLIAGENWKFAIKSYVAMGNIADYQGDVSLAIDCYLKGLAMSREHDLPEMTHDLCCNIGNIYSATNDPVNAEKMFRESKRIGQSGVDVDPAFISIVEANLALCYARMGEYEEAEARLQSLKDMTEANANHMDKLSVGLLETILYHAKGDEEKRDDAIRRLNETELESMDVYDAINEFCQHARLLLEIGKTEEFLTLVKRIEALAQSSYAEKKVLELWIGYYEQIGDEENCAKMALRYYKVANALEEERNKIVSHNITTRMTLEEEESRRKEVEKANLVLKQKSERDALTGMNNRYKLNELAETTFQRAYRDGLPLTFEILDIDCYKEYNDHYGHQAGDECLIRIAEAIRSLEKYEGVHTARYGGDEFVIIYENYSKQEVEKMAAELQEKIRGLNIEHKHSKVSDRVTITQGLFNKIPTGGNKTWDFLYGADMALYGAKQRSKNNFYVATSFEEARAYNQGDK